jgi:hypothetical protein
VHVNFAANSVVVQVRYEQAVALERNFPDRARKAFEQSDAQAITHCQYFHELSQDTYLSLSTVNAHKARGGSLSERGRGNGGLNSASVAWHSRRDFFITAQA